MSGDDSWWTKGKVLKANRWDGIESIDLSGWAWEDVKEAFHAREVLRATGRKTATQEAESRTDAE